MLLLGPLGLLGGLVAKTQENVAALAHDPASPPKNRARRVNKIGREGQPDNAHARRKSMPGGLNDQLRLELPSCVTARLKALCTWPSFRARNKGKSLFASISAKTLKSGVPHLHHLY